MNNPFYFDKTAVIEEELNEFETKIEGFQNRTLDPDEFKHRRLVQGVYGQRQPAQFMVRVKVPGGRLVREQIDALCKVVAERAKGPMHITTRQDIQIYFVKIGDIMPILRTLADHGLTTRESSGATIRNIITSPWAGHGRDQLFNIVPIVEQTVLYFLRHPETQHLPRKFKISFSENEKDYAAATIHDLGFIAKLSDGKPGFEVYMGGALGSNPMAGRVYKEFIPVEETLRHTLAILRAFEKHGDRSKRSEARLKFQLNKIGYEKFLAHVEEELQAIQSSGEGFPQLAAEFIEPANFDFSNPFDKASEAAQHFWFDNNVRPTVYQNEYMVLARVPNGDFTPDVFQALADAHDKWHSPEAKEYMRLSDSQNIVLNGIVVEGAQKKALFSEIYETLRGLKLERPGDHTFSDVITCLGSATCAAGITHSPGLATELSNQFEEVWRGDERFKGSVIHVSGCANSCARHHVATLGFAGRADTTFSDEQQAPAYNLYYGGALLSSGEVRMGVKINDKLLARRIPQFIRALIERFGQEGAGSSFNDYVASISKEEMGRLVGSFSLEKMPAKEDERLHYDWGKESPYVMEYGEGECS